MCGFQDTFSYFQPFNFYLKQNYGNFKHSQSFHSFVTLTQKKSFQVRNFFI